MNSDTEGSENIHILLLEDEPVLLESTSRLLTQAGYRVSEAKTLAEAYRLLPTRPDLMVLDIMLPDGSGVELCREIREKTLAPIIFLTVLGDVEQRVRGLQLGGDDYLVKPVEPAELLARIQAQLRKNEQLRRSYESLTFGKLKLDYVSHRATIAGHDVSLKPKEFMILLLLLQARGNDLSVEYLYRKVWGREDNDDLRTVFVNISTLRSKLNRNGALTELCIERSKSGGYRLILAAEDS